VFIEQDRREGGITYHRPHDWAVVVTSIGTCVEPFGMFDRHVHDVQIRNRDWEDDISRIDKIEFLSLDKQVAGDNVHGGYLLPRDGR
jgi:hypothetical protein